MMSKLSTLRAGLAGLATLVTGAVLATGCLDRPVVPATPSTSNVYVDQIIQSAVDKIDLLFMIDNSTSMADKQEILGAAVPVMVSRLVTPICVDATTGMPTTGNSDANGQGCGAGSVPEFSPIKDIHIAIVTSSLGSHGGNVCDSATNANDNGQTVGSVRGIMGWNNTGFLAWDPTGMKNTPPGEANSTTLTQSFTDMVLSAGETGCGYEASLEAWYRFLIDPEPPQMVVHDMASNVSVKQGINQTLLTQRSNFLRPDSLVAVIMLSDENDCSITDAGYGWFISTRTLAGGAENRMYRSTSACDSNPNSPCCMSCGDGTPPPAQCGLPSTSADPNCMQAAFLTANEDSVALRCWDTKRRFGFDLMYPTYRYSSALTAATICPDSSGYLGGAAPPGGCPGGTDTVNPLYDPLIQTKNGVNGKAGTGTRDTSLVFASAIVGVPWQDLASDDTIGDPNRLRYLTEDEMNAASPNRWAVVLGDPGNPNGPTLPSDPFMVETYLDRTTINGLSQTNPIVPTATLQPSSSMNPQANVINGHEQNVAGIDDLQYACIFPLGTPKTCANGMQACDCSPTASGDLAPVALYNSPLCNPPGTATQTYAKAYPGLRFLKVLHDFGKNAIPASVCPKVTAAGQADYGYNPAVSAIINRLKEALHGRCLPRPLDAVVDPDHPELGAQVPCAVIEAKYNDPAQGVPCGACNNAEGRKDPNPVVLPQVVKNLQEHGQCGVAGGRACENFCFCEIQQETGAAQDTCRKDPIAAGSVNGVPPGYCYISNKDSIDMKACAVDADCATGTCTGGVCAASGALAKCPTNNQQLLGFVNGNNNTVPTPALGAIGFIACLGASI